MASLSGTNCPEWPPVSNLTSSPKTGTLIFPQSEGSSAGVRFNAITTKIWTTPLTTQQ